MKAPSRRSLMCCAAVLAAACATQALADIVYAASTGVYSFVDITGTGTQVLADDDDATGAANIGFNFNFYGSPYSSLSISSNGVITFDGDNSSFGPVDFSLMAASPDIPTLAVWWDDWSTVKSEFPGSGAVYYSTVGSPGNQQFVVEWNNLYANFPPGSSGVTFEAILDEATGDILFQYESTVSGVSDGIVGDGNDHGGSGSVGLRDASTLTNAALEWEFAHPVLSDGEAILFSPMETTPEPGSLIVVAAGLLFFGGIRALSIQKGTK